MDIMLLSDDDVTVRLLGAESFELILKSILIPFGKELSDLDDEKQTRIKSTMRSYQIHSDLNAILYISVLKSFSIEDLDNFKDDEGINLEKLPHKSISSRAFGVTASAISLARYSKISKEFEFIFEGYYVLNIANGNHTNVNNRRRIHDRMISNILEEEIQTAVQLSKFFQDNNELTLVIDLYSKSMEPYELGFLHAFISAWTALEVFIATQFKKIQGNVNITLNEAPVHDIFSKRIHEVMKDKYRLLDKFSALSSHLNDPNANEHINLLKKSKIIRDGFFHSMSCSIQDLPLNDIQYLVDKYLKLYLTKEKKINGAFIKKSG
ncbi:hypothetical protein VH569_30640 [Azospirillum sp. 11R-A]|uniref:hypothetical protein n=1 Tax=Azospirillum sp. 11R-A TaxID=3111634 RepID=UPI003C1C120B